MDDLKVCESSNSPVSSPTPPAETIQRRSAPAPPQSSAAFLHHLHTNPKSHHITLTSSNTRHASAPPASKGTVPSSVNSNDPARSASAESSAASKGSEDGRLKPREALSRSGSARRSRPKTAPSRPFGAASPAGPDSPGLDRSPSGASQNPMDLAQAEGDSCIAAFARDEGMQQATADMSMLSVSPDARRPPSPGASHLLGRAGTMTGQESPPKDIRPMGTTTSAPSQAPSAGEDIGWDDFAKSYAVGNFDPNKTPLPPVRNLAPAPRSAASARSSPGTQYTSLDKAAQQPSSSDTNSSGTSGATSVSLLSTDTQISSAPSIAPSGRSLSTAAAPHTKNVAIKAKSLEAENLLARSQSPKPDKLMLPSYNLAAATVRMASASSGYSPNSLAPLGVPSPDKELTDPMANFVSPGATSIKEQGGSDPSHGSRFPLSRSMSSAIEPDRRQLLSLPVIQGSPVSTPSEHSRSSKTKHDSAASKNASPSWVSGGVLPHHIPPATAPVEKSIEVSSQEDYFGDSVSPPPVTHASRQASFTSSGSSSSQHTVTGNTPMTKPGAAPLADDQRKSSTLPEEGSDPEYTPPSIVAPSQVSELYEKLGWLAAPVPPDEMARRRALHRFNILHTSPDLNFDRIAHMAKLVFASKIVMIALIEGDTQWHKTQAGPRIDAQVPRSSSFCAHAILSRYVISESDRPVRVTTS